MMGALPRVTVDPTPATQTAAAKSVDRLYLSPNQADRFFVLWCLSGDSVGMA